jgi:uncharacterized membrane protein
MVQSTSTDPRFIFMSVYLWPLVAFLLVGAAGALWQSRNPETEAKARSRVLQHHSELPSWQRMRLWQTHNEQKQDPERIRRSAKRRAASLLATAGLLLCFLLTR